MKQIKVKNLDFQQPLPSILSYHNNNIHNPNRLKNSVHWKNSLVTYHSYIVNESSSYFQDHKYEWYSRSHPNYNIKTFCTIPIVPRNSTTQLPYTVDTLYCFDIEKKSPVTEQQKLEIKDYFKSSLFACLTCFWMIGGVVCLIQSLHIKRLKNICVEEALQKSYRLHTNLILTYIFGGVTYFILLMTIFISFFVGIKGYFGKSI
ncbi:unnamed protein product [Didymodactylos carnosus]|uniref:Uncharacterized protein n=1 Tax=Didymodactylos carnosus TaxID=1234261 RepID=A0A814YR49_9BILA|nr:unnamed protein product [Didymodactylos carnosus]CAF1232204.1 unnamed protein product [Didymodactylos carnosus]CAF3568349.1 unnamed protein product [Didymodactylos carnosus]CAF3994847.1 unnamed protein product [Didymodactylos carnosus]